MKRICMTGFDPVKGLGDESNPSFELIRNFPKEFMGYEVMVFEVPTAFNRNRDMVAEIIRTHRPDIFLGIGLSGSRFEITLENVAINFRDAGYMKDNDDMELHHENIYGDGGDGYISPMPVTRVVDRARSEGIMMSESYYCGTYCCNQVLYNGLYHRDKLLPDMLAGFLHVPYFPEYVIGKKAAPAMDREKSARALEILLEECIFMQRGE